ncbi:MAG: DUF1501 domain-containing protein [Candidatus Binatia bacterium]
MALTRRQFLKRSATLAAGATMTPAMQWLPGTNVAWAGGPSDAIVVFVQLYGGNDGLNTVYPVTGTQRTRYEEIRPTLKLPTNAGLLGPWADEGFNTSNGILSLGTDLSATEYALHPAMKAMHDIHLAGQLAVIPGVHYPFADYSHFRSEVIYYTGDPIGAAGGGWMGKYLDLTGFSSLEVPALMMGNDYNPLFTPTGTSLFAFNNLSELRFPAGSRRPQRSAAFTAMCAESALSDPGFFPELSSIGSTGVAAVNKFEEYYQSDAPNGKVEKLMIDGDGNYNSWNSLVYPSYLNEGNGTYSTNYLTEDLRHVAAVIRSDVGARFFHVGIGGFDSHSNQEQGLYHSYLLNRVSEALGAFWAEMKSTVTLPGGYEGDGYLAGDLSDRVLIVTLSEFGRTNKQNTNSASTAGTDHGGSSPQFVIGSTVEGGIHGTYPTLSDPQLKDDMRMAYDFRDLYGTILERWLNVPASEIGPGPGKLFAATPAMDWLGQNYTAYNAIPFLLP